MLQGTLFPPESSWKAPRLIDLPQDWNVSPRIGLDTETNDAKLTQLGNGARRGAYIAGISFALSKDNGHYLPLRHLGGDNMEDPAKALEYIRYQAKHYRGEIVGAKIEYDLDHLAEAGIVFPNVSAFKDVQVLEPLLDELQYSYSLDNILKRHGLELKEEDLLREAASRFGLKKPKAEMWKLPARYVGHYAEIDAVRPLELLEKQEAIVEERGLHRVWKLEQQCTPILVAMRRRGVAIDLDHLAKVERWTVAEEMKAWGELQRETGVAIRVGDAMKAEVLSHALKAVGIETPWTVAVKPKPSITKDWLEALNHPAGKIIRRARQVSQIRTTFVNALREHAIIRPDGEARIHCTFNQIVRQDDDAKETEGAAYGRLSCCDPNLQQQPARDPEIGPFWRKTYVPDKGKTWGSLDFSQQEPKLALHFAVLSGSRLIGSVAHQSAEEAMARKWADPNSDDHDQFTKMVHGDDVVNDPKFKHYRNVNKNIYLGICYGMGEPKMCRQLNLPTMVIENERNGRRYEVAGPEGRAILDLINVKVPYVKATAKAVEKIAKARGYVLTLYGRQLHFPKDHNGNYDFTHKAFNRVIQGSAADQTKAAMVALHNEGYELQLQVHDEFDLSLDSREQGERAAKIMRECVPLKVPSKVDVECGPSWGEIK